MSKYLLFDQPNAHPDFITNHIPFDGVVNSPKKSNRLLSWIMGCMKVIRISNRDDTIVSWFDFQAVMCWWICKFLFTRRKIVCINLMLKDKQTKRNKLAKYLYKKALSDTNFVASVTSRSYGEYLQRQLNICKYFTLIHDVYHESYNINYQEREDSHTVFCGGRNGRDWNFMIALAKAMPNVKFKFVVSGDNASIFPKLSNISLLTDIPFSRFLEEMCSSTMVALPLDTEAPAGLIVLFQAAANLKPVLITKTATTCEYVSEGRGYALPKNIELWIRQIQQIIENKGDAMKKASNLLSFLRTGCSEMKFTDGIQKMINAIQ